MTTDYTRVLETQSKLIKMLRGPEGAADLDDLENAIIGYAACHWCLSQEARDLLDALVSNARAIARLHKHTPLHVHLSKEE